jgi:hypothetical protein
VLSKLDREHQSWLALARGNKHKFVGFPWFFPDIYPVSVAGDGDEDIFSTFHPCMHMAQ